MPEGPITHLSYSQISTYLTCPLRYKFHYADLIPPVFTTAALVFGPSLHRAAAAYYESRLLGDPIRPDQMLDVHRDTWRGSEGIKYFNGDNEESLLQKARQLINVFHEQVNPDVMVLGVEEYFEVQFATEAPPFHGYIDLIEQDQDGRITVADLKTASKKLADSAIHTNMQLTTYSIGAGALGFDPKQLTLRLDVLTKTKNPELTGYETTRTQQERNRFVKCAME